MCVGKGCARGRVQSQGLLGGLCLSHSVCYHTHRVAPNGHRAPRPLLHLRQRLGYLGLVVQVEPEHLCVRVCSRLRVYVCVRARVCVREIERGGEREGGARGALDASQQAAALL